MPKRIPTEDDPDFDLVAHCLRIREEVGARYKTLDGLLEHLESMTKARQRRATARRNRARSEGKATAVKGPAKGRAKQTA
jgi:hypothetical protein